MPSGLAQAFPGSGAPGRAARHFKGRTRMASVNVCGRWGALAGRLVLAFARIERTVNRMLHDWQDPSAALRGRGEATLGGKLGVLLERVETLPMPEAYRRDLRVVLRQASGMADYLYRISQHPLADIVGHDGHATGSAPLSADELQKLEGYARQAEAVATRLPPLASLVNLFRADGVERELSGRPLANCPNSHERWLQAA